jgi:hypothetical protein
VGDRLAERAQPGGDALRRTRQGVVVSGPVLRGDREHGGDQPLRFLACGS